MGADPVAGLAVVVTLLDPFLDEITPHRVVPILAAAEAKHFLALALDRFRLVVLHFDRIRAVRGRAPPQ